MSNDAVKVTPQEEAADKAFIKERKESPYSVWIKRHSLQARITHDVTAICCILLVISGLFVFIPPLAAAIGGQAVFAIRMSHRVIGIIFIAVPVISAILAPKGAWHIFKEDFFTKWDSDDKKWIALFLPYLFTAKWLHMPDQHLNKSGQRFADGLLLLLGMFMAVTGVVLVLGTSVFELSAGAHAAWLLAHDIGFFLIAIFGMAHIFLGAGIFQPYRGSANLMFGDGTVKDSDALYHWGHWAREELTDGKNVVYKDKKTGKIVKDVTNAPAK